MNFLKSIKDRFLPNNEKETFTQIIPRVYAFNFPTEERRKSLKENFAKITADYKIWNVSEYTYLPEIFDFNVSDYSRPGYPNPSIHDLLIISQEMANWLDAGPDHILFVHCQQSFSRTALVLICLLYFMRMNRDRIELETQVTNALNTVLLNNHRLYLSYFESCFNGVVLNRHPIRIKRITLSEPPLVKLLKEHAEDSVLSNAPRFRPYLQLFQRQAVVFNSIDR